MVRVEFERCTLYLKLVIALIPLNFTGVFLDYRYCTYIIACSRGFSLAKYGMWIADHKGVH